MDYQKIVEQVITNPRYKRNIEFGVPRSGHPEGKIKNHIIDLENNLEKLKYKLRDTEEYWKLKFLIHVHDTFKAEAISEQISSEHPLSHANIARQFASEIIDDTDLLNTIQYHDENHALWLQFKDTGQYDKQRLMKLINLIQDWDLFLAFTIVDGFTNGKDIEKLPWFINEVRKFKQTRVDETWVNFG